jgi:hypothetical protein
MPRLKLGWINSLKTKSQRLYLSFRKKTDRYFSNDWVFKRLTTQEIDHFKMGYVLTWQKKMEGLLIVKC